MEHIKIQINSGEALHKLIGDNAEMRLEFKDRIVDALIKDHIQPLIGVDNYAAIMKEVKAEVDKCKEKHVAEALTKPENYRTIGLKPEIVSLIKTKIDEELRTLVADKLRAERANIEVKLDNLLSKNRDIIIKYITSEIDQCINARVDERLKVILEHITELSKFYAIERTNLKATADKPRKITLDL